LGSKNSLPAVGVVECRPVPGAPTSTHEPKLENAERALPVVAPTAMTLLYAAGYDGVSVVSLPALATTTTSCATAYATAACSVASI